MNGEARIWVGRQTEKDLEQPLDFLQLNALSCKHSWFVSVQSNKTEEQEEDGDGKREKA